MTNNAGGPVVVVYNNLMSTGRYIRTMPMGCLKDHPEFQPFYSPQTMLEMGVFEGKYLNSCQDEYPADWFKSAKLCATPNPAINFFGVKSRLATSWWKEKDLIHPQDPRG